MKPTPKSAARKKTQTTVVAAKPKQEVAATFDSPLDLAVYFLQHDQREVRKVIDGKIVEKLENASRKIEAAKEVIEDAKAHPTRLFDPALRHGSQYKTRDEAQGAIHKAYFDLLLSLRELAELIVPASAARDAELLEAKKRTQREGKVMQ